MATTATRQRNAVSEGIALGLVVQGRPTVPYEKTRVDLAFEGAWRDWPHRSNFRQVSTDLGNGSDGIWVMTRADEGKSTSTLYWSTAGELIIHSRQHDWDPADPADLEFATQGIDGGLALEGWVDLARRFLERFDRTT